MKAQKQSTETVTLAGIRLTLVRKRIRNIYLSVRDGRVRLSAPPEAERALLEKLVADRREWILGKLAIQQEVALPPKREYKSGEQVRLFGVSYPLIAETGRENAVALTEEGEVHLTCRTDLPSAREAVLSEWYRCRLTEKAKELLFEWEVRTGLHASALTIRQMRSRWGSCQPVSGRITLALSLAKHPLPCLSYVVLHELTHLLYPNHGRGFHAFLDKWMPDNREKRAMLKNSALLEESRSATGERKQFENRGEGREGRDDD